MKLLTDYVIENFLMCMDRRDGRWDEKRFWKKYRWLVASLHRYKTACRTGRRIKDGKPLKTSTLVGYRYQVKHYQEGVNEQKRIVQLMVAFGYLGGKRPKLIALTEYGDKCARICGLRVSPKQNQDFIEQLKKPQGTARTESQQKGKLIVLNGGKSRKEGDIAPEKTLLVLQLLEEAKAVLMFGHPGDKAALAGTIHVLYDKDGARKEIEDLEKRIQRLNAEGPE